MNKMCHTPTLYRLGPALLLFSFLIAGCAGSPSEVRYDDTMKTYVSAENENANTYTAGQHDKATAHYILRPGNRPDFAPRDTRTKTVPQTYPSTVPDTQLADLQMVLEVSDVLFEFDKWVIRADVVPELDKWANYFQNNSEVTAEIYGHADSTGPSAYNQSLSVKRAQAVVNYLVDKGVDPKRFTAKGYGESQPAVPNTTGEGRQKNRRVELNL
jgi:outer membrane protein OmpA-like peptidoglycan-associated protein